MVTHKMDETKLSATSLREDSFADYSNQKLLSTMVAFSTRRRSTSANIGDLSRCDRYRRVVQPKKMRPEVLNEVHYSLISGYLNIHPLNLELLGRQFPCPWPPEKK